MKLVAAMSLLAVLTGAMVANAQDDRYWELGVGAYFGGTAGMTDLDVARYDWIYVCFGNISANEETAALIDRLLQINPELKIVLRLWPIMGKGDCPENRSQATFLHYLYDPEVRQAVDDEIQRQFDVIADNISRPENIVGLTFLEELPGHFSGRPMSNGAVSWDMERFRAEIEAERGKPLVWDEETAAWWGEKWVEAINGIHRAMKQASDGRTIWYYQAVGSPSLDRVPEGTPLTQRGLVPIRFEQIIQPGLCDGFFAYPNNAEVWRSFTEMAREHNWPFFSQLSHPGGMRLCPWEECIALARERMPQNMGYFLYCPGDCSLKHAWNDDPQFAGKPEQNIRGVSMPLHQRQILAAQDVGMDVVQAAPRLRLHPDLPLSKAEPGGYLHLSAIVENVMEPSWFRDPDEATARGCMVSLALPEGFSLDPAVSPPADLAIGDLAPGELRLADWWVSVGEGYDGTPVGEFGLRAAAAAGGPTELKLSEDTAIPLGLPHAIGATGTRWIEPGFRLAETVQPEIVIQPVSAQVTNPSLSDGTATVSYESIVTPGQRLILRPGGRSELITLPLLEDVGGDRVDPGDPSGFRALDDGYLVVKLPVNREVTPGQSLHVALQGKAEGGAQSHLVMRFELADGTTGDAGGLTNRFSADWRTVEGDVTVPENAVRLQQVFLYRFKQEGQIWYGPARITIGDGPAAAEDCSARVRGTLPTVPRGGFAVIRYEDLDVPAVAPRAVVQLVVPEQ
jgi:hypothetical protein